MADRVSQLEIDVEDCATMLLRFPNGTYADVHVDFMQRSYSRNCVLAGETGKLIWDFTSNSVQIVRPEADTETIKFECDVNYMYIAELQHFLECVENGVSPRFSVQDAIATLRVALAARASAEERKWVSVG